MKSTLQISLSTFPATGSPLACRWERNGFPGLGEAWIRGGTAAPRGAGRGRRREELARWPGLGLPRVWSARDTGTPRIQLLPPCGTRSGAGGTGGTISIRAEGEAGGPGRPGARARVEGAPAEGRGPPLRELLALQSRPGAPGALRLKRDFPVSWAEEKPGTWAQSPPQSGADPSRIRPAVWP